MVSQSTEVGVTYCASEFGLELLLLLHSVVLGVLTVFCLP